MLVKNTLVIGDVGVGKTTYLLDRLQDVEGVFWLGLGTPLPEGVNGTSVWNYKQWLAANKAAGIADAKVLVLDGISNLYALLIAEIVMLGNKNGEGVGRNPEQKDFSAAAYRFYQGFLQLGALNKTMHASILTREKEEGKGDNKTKVLEIHLAPMISGFVLPAFPNAAYITMKILAGNVKYAVQENPVLAKQLIAAKVS